MPMFARVECVFVLRASIRCMNDYTWRRRRRCSSHTAHRQIRHPVDQHAPSLPSLFGTFMLAIESPNEDLGRILTEVQASPIALSLGEARATRVRVPVDVGYIYRSVALWRTKKIALSGLGRKWYQKHTSNNKSNNFNVASQKVALSGLGLNQSSATSPFFWTISISNISTKSSTTIPRG